MVRWRFRFFVYLSKILEMSAKFDPNLDDICKQIIEGETFTNIAQLNNVDRSTLFLYLNNPNNSARAQEACILSAHIFTDKARQALEGAKNGTMVDVMLAKELSQHYMKMASFRNRSIYGEEKATTPAPAEILPRETLLLLAERINGNAA